jgi:leucyl aminopeptidase
VSGDITKIPVDAIVVNLFEGVKSPGGATGAVDRALDGTISNLIAAKEIKGKLNEVVSIYTFGKIEPQRVVVAGLGKREEFTFDKIREVMAATCKSLRSAEVKRVATIVHGAGIGGMNPMTCAQAITEGSLLGTYTFRKYMTKEPEFGEIDELLIVERDQKKLRKSLRVTNWNSLSLNGRKWKIWEWELC